MDEVEALARRVAVLSRGRIAAEGATASLGGRDQREATIRFSLPDGVAVGDLPVAVTRVHGASVEVRTADEVPVLHRLTGWALERGVAAGGAERGPRDARGHLPCPHPARRRVAPEEAP